MLIKTFYNSIKAHPRIYDLVKPLRRRLGWRGVAYDRLNQFSQERNGHVSFIQIGAADGLHNDPIREFIVRDHWRGILIEPLPTVFEQLQRNYAHVPRHLRFINAAISSQRADLTFYAPGERFLLGLTEDDRLIALQNSSFARAHLEQFFAKKYPGMTDIAASHVPCMTVASLLDKYGAWLGPLDLLVIDAEGHEPDILGSIDFGTIRPAGIIFESANLGKAKKPLFNLLRDHRYTVTELAGDAFACLN